MKPIGRLEPIQVSATAKSLLYRITVIAGWTIDPATSAILFDQFAKFLNERYPTLNSEEIEYAVRNKSTTVKDWGKSINLSLIAEVLDPYLIERKQASEIEAQTASKLESEKLQLEAPKMNNKEIIDTAFEIWKGWNPETRWEYIMTGTYQALKDEGLLVLTKEQQVPIFKKAELIANDREYKDENYFGKDPGKKAEWVKITARKLAVHEWFSGRVENIVQ